MFKHILATVSLLAFLPVSAVLAEETPVVKTPPAAVKAEPVKDYVIIDVDGTKVNYSEVQGIWNSMFPQGQEVPPFEGFPEEIRQNLLRGIVSERLLVGEAKKAGLEKRDDVKRLMEMAANRVLLQMIVEEKTSKLTTDDKIKAAYDAKVKALKGQEEVKARHILVPTEEEAKEIVKQLKDGADFAKLAAEKSKDDVSGKAGGDLGYFTKDRMVPEFSKAAFALKKEQVSAPVQSPFGWHVIKLEDRRPVPTPTYEEMKEQIKDEIVRDAMNAHIEALLSKAKLTYYGADGKEKEFKKTVKVPQPKP